MTRHRALHDRFKSASTGKTGWTTILVQAVSQAAMPIVQQEITSLLMQRHHLKPDGPRDFLVRSQEDIAQAATATATVMGGLLAGIAAVSLLVGGIGIMNIMLVSVTERTREIGIRMAVGARGGDILVQFLIEAVTLSIIGGGIGIASGMGISQSRRLPHALAHAHAGTCGSASPPFPARSSASSPVFIPRGRRPSSTRLTLCATNSA